MSISDAEYRRVRRLIEATRCAVADIHSQIELSAEAIDWSLAVLKRSRSLCPGRSAPSTEAEDPPQGI